MADDERRVEPRGTLVGSGAGASPERIADIQRRAEEVEKLTRKKPTKRFAEVMAEGAVERDDEEEELSEKEKKRRALPKKGPRPNLVHPVQRDVYGLDEDADDEVILKG